MYYNVLKNMVIDWLNSSIYDLINGDSDEDGNDDSVSDGAGDSNDSGEGDIDNNVQTLLQFFAVNVVYSIRLLLSLSVSITRSSEYFLIIQSACGNSNSYLHMS